MFVSNISRNLCAALVLGAAALAAGCGGGGANAPATPATPAATDLQLSAVNTTVAAGGPAVQLSATLNGSGAIAWQLAAGSPGTLSAASGASVSYTPPAAGSIVASTMVTVVATSGSLSKTVTLTLQPAPGLTLLAGTLGTGLDYSIDGVGAAARFSNISSVTADAGGNVYVSAGGLYGAATPAGSIRKIAADGTVTTLSSPAAPAGAPAGSPTIDALASAADGSLYFTQTVTVVSDPSVIIPHSYARKLASDGSVTDLAPLSAYASPGSQGRFYAITNQVAIGVVQPDGSVLPLAGDSTATQTETELDGTGAAARFGKLSDFTVDRNGTLYAIDATSIRQVTPAGVVTTLAHFTPQAAAPAPAILTPRKISVDASGNIVLLYRSDDKAYYEIRKLSGGAIVPWYAVGTPQGPYSLHASLIQAMADGSVITAGSTSVTRIGTDGKATLLAGIEDGSADSVDGQGADARYLNPGMLAADHDGNVYSVENAYGYQARAVVRKTTPAGVASTFASLDQGFSISGMVITPANQLMISTLPLNAPTVSGGAIYQLEAGGKLTLFAGQPGANTGSPLQSDGSGAAARFGNPALAGVDGAGNLYVQDKLDASNTSRSVRRITPQAAVSTIAALPAGLHAAPDGNTYQIDPSGSAIDRVTPAGVTTIVAGSLSGPPITVPGPLPAQLYQARAIVPTGTNTFVVAAGSSLLRLVLPPAP